MHKKISLLVLSLILLLSGSSTSFASGFYVAPKAGGLIALDESNADFTAGITLGYRWVKLVALEASYSRIFSTVDDNFLDLNIVVSGYRAEIFWPYALIGGGVGISTASNADPEPLFRIGGG